MARFRKKPVRRSLTKDRRNVELASGDQVVIPGRILEVWGAGSISVQTEEVHGPSKTPMVFTLPGLLVEKVAGPPAAETEESPPAEEESPPSWGLQMTPAQYLKLYPGGPNAERAQALVDSWGLCGSCGGKGGSDERA